MPSSPMSRSRRPLLLMVSLACLLILPRGVIAAEAHAYRFGVLPLQSPNKLAAMFLPVTDALAARLHRPVQFVTAPNFSVFMQRVAAHDYDIVYLNPLLYTQAAKAGYRVIDKVAGEPFTGILVVRKDSGISEIDRAHLKPGLRLGFPDSNAYAATIMNARYLAKLGMPVDRYFHARYFGSQDSVLMAVYSGLVDIAGTWKPSLRSMPAAVQRELRIVAETPPQPQMPIAVRDDMPGPDAAAISQTLVDLRESARGRAILAGLAFPQGFVPARPAEYAHLLR